MGARPPFVKNMRDANDSTKYTDEALGVVNYTLRRPNGLNRIAEVVGFYVEEAGTAVWTEFKFDRFSPFDGKPEMVVVAPRGIDPKVWRDKYCVRCGLIDGGHR